MKGMLIVKESDELDVLQTYIYVDDERYDYVISIASNLDDDFNTLISKPYDFDKTINLEINVNMDFENKDMIKKLQQIKKDRLKYLNNVEYIMFLYNPAKVFEYLKNNPILMNKKIVFKVENILDSKMLNEVIKNLGNNTSNIYFDIEGNNNLVEFKEYQKTFNAINNMIEEIKKFNFSPLETIMYVYDLVRDKVYNKEDINEDATISRDLTNVLLGDKIVCAGYAQVFETLLKQLGIDCKKVSLTQATNTSGHARNVIHVKDDKYNIDGVYYFDTTWDSKKTNDNNHFLSYKYFALTKKAIDRIDKGIYKDEKLPAFSPSMIYDLEEILEEEGWSKVPKDIITTINYMSYLINEKQLIDPLKLLPFFPESSRPDIDKTINEAHELMEYFDKTLSADTLLEVLYNVRKIQFYNNPSKYPFEIQDFYKIVINSGWNFNGTTKEKLFFSVASEKEKAKIKEEQLLKYDEKTELSKQIEQIKFTNVIKNISEEKKNKGR